MLRASKSFLLVLSFLSLQLSLFGGGADCAVTGAFPQSGASVERSGTDVASMNMSGMNMDMAGVNMDMTGMDMAPPPATNPHHVAAAAHDEESCDTEGARTGCDSMTVCVFAAVTSPASIRNVRSTAPSRMPTLAVRTPPSEGDAPDLPPPRA